MCLSEFCLEVQGNFICLFHFSAKTGIYFALVQQNEEQKLSIGQLTEALCMYFISLMLPEKKIQFGCSKYTRYAHIL